MVRIHLAVKIAPTLLLLAPISYLDFPGVTERPTVLSNLNLLVRIDIPSYPNLFLPTTTFFILFLLPHGILYNAQVGRQEPIRLPCEVGNVLSLPQY